MWFFKVLSNPEQMKWEVIKQLSELTCKWSLIYIPLILICEGVKCPAFILPPNNDYNRSVTFKHFKNYFQMWSWLAIRTLSPNHFTNEDQRNTNQASLTGKPA